MGDNMETKRITKCIEHIGMIGMIGLASSFFVNYPKPQVEVFQKKVFQSVSQAKGYTVKIERPKDYYTLYTIGNSYNPKKDVFNRDSTLVVLDYWNDCMVNDITLHGNDPNLKSLANLDSLEAICKALKYK